MIPSTTNKVKVTEDWKKIYQSFKNADFKSYDFETLRRTMISYLQENFPEDFNDYIESSEYLALIDVIAYLGQNLSFRIDLNARENFLETAQRRDSILRLAQLVSYNPKRNTPANGLLKVTAISTSDIVFDSNGTNLSNTTIGWNDSTNGNWYQQFISILNSVATSNFGNPIDKKSIDGIQTEQYRVNSSNVDVPAFSFNTNINGISMNFEIVSALFSGQDYIYEEAPRPAGKFSFLYRDDNKGSASPNNGFFVHFRQGSLSTSDFTVDNPVPNEIIGVNTPSINDTDVWLWQLDKNGNYPDEPWTKVSSLIGNNIIYNSLNKTIRSLYSVTTRDDDQIDLNFADGVFGNLPQGQFKLFYRQSNGLTYVIKPEQMSGVVISVPYVNAIGQIHTLTLTMGLQYTVSNSSGTESNLSIQTKAPQAFYSQNRMITAEDYNIVPLTAGNDVLKVKSVNRISSGLSRYFELSDVTGRYSNTNIFGVDGILYKESKNLNFEFEFTTRAQILAVLKNQLASVVNSEGLKSFYFEKYPQIDVASSGAFWNEVNKQTNESRGYFTSVDIPIPVGLYSETNLRYFLPGALVKFTPGAGKYFDTKNNIKTIPSTGIIPLGGRKYIWTTVKQVVADGYNAGEGTLDDGTGPIILNSRVPSRAKLEKIIPKYQDILPYTIENEIANICQTQRNLGLTFDQTTRTWQIITNSNLNLNDPFSLGNQNNIESIGLDASWLVVFVWTGKKYTVTYRTTNYIFESQAQTSFFVDNSTINYDYVNNQVIKDRIDVLSVNYFTNPTSVDYRWQIDSPVIENDGYIQPRKVNISFYNYVDQGNLLDPTAFDEIVQPDQLDTDTNAKFHFVYFQRSADGARYNLTDTEIIAFRTESDFNSKYPDKNVLTDGQLFYFYDDSLNVVKYWSVSLGDLVFTDEYFGRTGRSDLKFNYVHNSGDERRIDPSKSNLIDVYLLTVSYDNEYRSYLAGLTAAEPLPPTTQSLYQNYGSVLNNVKAISDEIIFHPVKYKILFGDKADTNLQATFKAVRNPNIVTTDNDLKARILDAINTYFSIENWDFGQSFYFGELSAYVMNSLTPDITNFIIVPKNDSGFGSLFEISCPSDEVFISGATIANIEIIDAITASQIKSQQQIVTSTGS